MDNHKHCPTCDTQATTVVDTQPGFNTIERVRVCEDCSTQYVVEYGRPEITEINDL